MKVLFFTAASVALFGTYFCQRQSLLTLFPVFDIGFGDIENPAIQQNFTNGCITKCDPIKSAFARCFYTHPYACNLFIQCLRIGHLLIIYGRRTSEGTMYDERDNTQKDTITNGVPNLGVCQGPEHPCVSGRPYPIDASQCGGYYTCKGDVVKSDPCPEGYGFSAWTGECDVPCKRSIRKLLKRTCGSSSKPRHFFINETVVYGDSKLPVLEITESICPASTSYQTEGKCGCDKAETVVEACKTITAIHLSSSDNTWQRAINQQPVQGSSALSGNLKIGDATSLMPRAGFFDGADWVVAQGLNGNDLGLYFNLSFTFASMKKDGRTPGFDFPRDQNGPLLVALTDNGADGKQPSYGCHLRVERTNRGKVECFIKPSLVSDLPPTSDVTITGPEVDLTRKVSAVFSKDDGLVRLVVRAEGGAEVVENRRVPPGTRASGNAAPLTIGKSTGHTDFVGFMDDMFLKKFCGPFLI